MQLIVLMTTLTRVHYTPTLSLSLSHSHSTAVNPTTCNTSVRQIIISTRAAASKTIDDDELIIIVPEKRHQSPPFIGVRGEKDWNHTFAGLKPSVVYRIQLDFASLAEVGSVLFFMSSVINNNVIFT